MQFNAIKYLFHFFKIFQNYILQQHYKLKILEIKIIPLNIKYTVLIPLSTTAAHIKPGQNVMRI